MSRTYVAVNWQNRSWSAEWSYGTQTRLLCPRCDWRCWAFELDDPPTFCPRCRTALRRERGRHRQRKGGFATVPEAKAYLLERFPYEVDRIAAIDDDRSPPSPRPPPRA
ncbi:MAG: hypothetical protein KY469_09850 [Actinobacteria bacterium]|nr:hypothetical protein [Actinomycetota bacterium]